MEEFEDRSLCIFLENFNLNQKVKLMENDKIIYEGKIGQITVDILNQARVLKNSAYVENSSIVVQIEYSGDSD